MYLNLASSFMNEIDDVCLLAKSFEWQNSTSSCELVGHLVFGL